MLNDAQRELLSAAADGELTIRQETALARLLEASAEARKLLRELQATRQRLRQLPRQAAPPELTARILERIRPVTPQTRPAPLAPRTPGGPLRSQRFARSLPYGIAASVLLLAGVGSFWVTLLSQQPIPSEPSRETARHHTPTLDPAAFLPERDVLGTPPVPPLREVLPPPRPARTTGSQIAHAPTENPPGAVPQIPAEVAPSPRPMHDWIGAAFSARPAPLDRVEVRLPLFASVAEFDRPDVLARMTDELTREAAFRLDLFAPDSVAAVQMLLAVNKEIGLATRIEPVAHDRLKKQQHSSWLLYTEALTPEDVVKLASRLAVRARARNGGEESLLDGHFYPARQQDQKGLRELFGVDLGLWKRPTASKPEPARSVTSGTLSQIEKSLRGSSGKGHSAILVLDQPAYLRTHPAASRDIRQYLDDRGERKPDTIPLIVVIRPAAR